MMSKIPITVGIVGHLDAVITKGHQAQIENLFLDLAETYPNSPIYLFSPLAESADRFVANILLKIKTQENLCDRFELIVPTPFEIEEYKDDFSTKSKIEFDNLLLQAKRTFCVGVDDVNERPAQYLKIGKFVADSSLILIALWDGKEGKLGGTADIVEYKKNGGDEGIIESTFEHDGSVFILPCNRVSSSVNPNLKENDLSLKLVMQDSTIKQSLDKIEEINKDSLKLTPSEQEKSKRYLFDSPAKLNEPQTEIMNYYSILDTLSFSIFQKKNNRTIAWLFIIGFLFIISFEVYKHLGMKISMLGISLLLISIATVIYHFANKNKFHKKYLYNRTIAEALRIQFYWNLAGINQNVANFILRIHKKEFTWIKHILSSIYGTAYGSSPTSTITIASINENWIRNQADFFKLKMIQKQKVLLRWKLLANIAFGTAFILLFSILILANTYTKHQLHFLVVVIGSLLGLFAIVRGFIEIKGFKQIVNQYELMNEIYQRAENKIEELMKISEELKKQKNNIQNLFFVVGKEALIENGSWYLIFKEKEPKVEGIGP